MRYRWSMVSTPEKRLNQIREAANISPLLARSLLSRGISGPEEVSTFLEPRLKTLQDPFKIPEMRQAVEALFKARSENRLIIVFGDYDVDGVTSTALLSDVLSKLGWRVRTYLPERISEGYGLSMDAAKNLLTLFEPALILAVDCGTTSAQPISLLNQAGFSTVIVDHHQAHGKRPDAVALVNPHVLLNDAAEGGTDAEDAPFIELCSVGLCFKLAHAIVKEGRLRGLPAALELDLKNYLDLVALGTIADLVPLTGENRIFCRFGLQALHTTSRPGLKALKKVAATRDFPGCSEVAFQLAPRLNAAGRLENAAQALRLLLAVDELEAQSTALILDTQNRERQKIEKTIHNEVMERLKVNFQSERDFVIVEGDSNWHVGVVGIVASRVMQEFYRPTIICGGEGDSWRGSGRSIEGFDLARSLNECSDLLLRFGGHSMAAGITIAPGNLQALRDRLNPLVRDRLNPELLKPALRLEGEVDLGEITFESLNDLAKLGPFGQGNPPVRLLARNLFHQRPPSWFGKDNLHLKLWVTDGRSTFEGISWSCREVPPAAGRFHLAFTPELSEFQGNLKIQLKVLDWQKA